MIEESPKIIEFSKKIYLLLPRGIRESPKFSHYSSVLFSKLTPNKYAYVNVFGSFIYLNLKHPGDIQRIWGVWEPDLRRFLQRELKSGEIFIDVGAHRGTYTTLARKLVGESGRIIAFEPFPEHYQSLVKSVERNKFCNVECIKGAASSEKGISRLTSSSPHLDKVGDLEIEKYSIDDVVDNADIIKIDTDGSEYEVVLGAERLIDSGCQVVIEFSDFQYQSVGDVYTKINNFFKHKGYSAHIIQYDGSSLEIEPDNLTYVNRHVVFKKKA
ncbi:MAG: FkbM family methyltransferase [Gammaproteobacteria bacterium]|nr:FkbM family methyltransferase [Gammaproteobacteria bacterium]